MDKMFGEDGLRLNILRGDIPALTRRMETDKDFNLNDDIHIQLSVPDFINKSDDSIKTRTVMAYVKS